MLLGGTTVQPVTEDTGPIGVPLQGNPALFFGEDLSPDTVPTYSPYEG